MSRNYDVSRFYSVVVVLLVTICHLANCGYINIIGSPGQNAETLVALLLLLIVNKEIQS